MNDSDKVRNMSELLMDSADFFDQNGYMIKRGFVGDETLKSLQLAAKNMVDAAQPPAEYEADVKYQGAPESREVEGGQTIRRFLEVFDRSQEFAQFGRNQKMKTCLSQLMGDDIYLVRSHHNSLMSKQPKYSSQTNWHRDIRYWHYSKENLISAWLAIGNETKANGALLLIPGSHRVEFERKNFDDDLFFRHDLPENQALIDSAIVAEMSAGDVLFFHCRTLHAATNNQTDQSKLALVYTYRPGNTVPLPGTRSSSFADEKL